MQVDGKPMRPIRVLSDGRLEIVDQTRLPHEFALLELATVEDAARAIATMQVRGAPLIGVTAAYGVALAMRRDPSDRHLEAAVAGLAATRPTAVNLRWALARLRASLIEWPLAQRAERAWAEASALAEEDVAINAAIGRHGLALIEAAHRRNPARRSRS